MCIILCLSLNVFSENTTEKQPQSTQNTESSAQSTTASLQAVSGFKMLSADGKSITLTWNPYDGALSYTVSIYDEKTKKYTEVAMTKDTTCKIDSLSVGRAYKFKIAAMVLVQDEVKYTPKSQTLNAVTAAGKVKRLLTDSVSKDSITLSWSKADGAAKYEIYSYNSDEDKFKICAVTEKTQFTVKSLEKNTLYLFKIRAVAVSKDARACGKFSEIHSEFTAKDGSIITKAQAADYYNGVINALKNEKDITLYHKKSIEASALSCSEHSILRTVKNIASLFNGTKTETVRFSGGVSAQGSLNEFIQPYSSSAHIRACDILKFSVSEKDKTKRIKIVLKSDKGGAHNNRAVVGARVEKVSTAPIRIKKLTQNFNGCVLALTCKNGKFQSLSINCEAQAAAKCKVSTLGFETTVGYKMNEVFTKK